MEKQFPGVYVERKGGTVMLRDCRQYYKVRVYKSGNTYWRCANKKKMSCKGSVTVNVKQEVINTSPHCDSCSPNEIQNEISLSIDNLKKQVKVSDEPIPKLYNDTLTKYQNSTYDILTTFPSYSNLKHSLYNARNQSLGVSKTVFSNAEVIEVPPKFKDFLFTDYYYEGTRIIVFCSLKARELMIQLDEFFADGTFKCCPKPFVQLFTIYGDTGSTNESTNVVPLVFAFLSDKKQSTYFALFEMLRSQLSWDPKILHCDFEMSILNSLKEFCPTLKIVGCYYHWSQCIWRKSKKLGISKSKSKRVKRTISLCSILPLLPSERIKEGWDYIKKESGVEANKLIQYIERYWIKGNFDNFSQLISVFSQRHRTNNISESSHAKLSRRINAKNVTMLRLLNVLENFTTLSSETHKRRNIQIENDDYIREIQLQLITGDITVGHALDKLR